MAEGALIALRDRRVAVTGANGFIGSAVCRALAAAGADVVGVEVALDHEAELRAAGVRLTWGPLTLRILYRVP